MVLLSWLLSVHPMQGAPCFCSQRLADWPAPSSVLDLLECVSDPYFPPLGLPEWETVDPQALGWDTSLLPDLQDYLSLQNTRAFLLLKEGRIALEYYWGLNLSGQPFDEESIWYWASAGKTLTATLVGLAQEKGLLALQDGTSQYLGAGWSSLNPSQESQILLRHQLTMTSGLDDGVADPYCTEAACLLYLAEPGSRWAYHNAPYTLLDSVLEQASGQPFPQFFNQNLRDPIGMAGFWLPSGYNNVYYSTARSAARFGLLMLRKGIWDGTAILQDSAYLQAMHQPSQALNPSYGYLWWLNGQDHFLLPGSAILFPGPIAPHAPPDMVAAMGKNGQLINVVPSLGLVLVRFGDYPDQSLVTLGFQDDIWEKLLAILCPATP